MIRECTESDFGEMYAVINDSARAYHGVIPVDCWHEPYMSREELRHEIDDGIRFWCVEEAGRIIGVMGIQDRGDAALIRHAYVATYSQRSGIGGSLIRRLLPQTDRPVFVGTWAAALWAVRFYEKHGFRLVTPEAKDRLLRRYWSISDRQIETSVVLAGPEKKTK